MSCLNPNFVVHESNCVDFDHRVGSGLGVSSRVRVCSSIGGVQINPSIPGKTLDFQDQNAIPRLNIRTSKSDPSIPRSPTPILQFNRSPNFPTIHEHSVPSQAQASKSQKWWQKSLAPNMVEIQSAQQLVDFLQNSGDNLVILCFYSPACGGCKTLHPKICQMAEMNPEAVFLKVNYDSHKAMCQALHVHVLPFFRFYRGSQGKVCSFSCTNATVKKFKDALSKHGTDPSSVGMAAKGLEEEEMAALASLGLISWSGLDLLVKKMGVYV